MTFLNLNSRKALISAFATAALVAGCGGGSDDSPAPAPVDTRNTLVEPAQVVRWSISGFDGIAIAGVAAAADGGVWTVGAEGGLYGRPFLRKIGGGANNPCGTDGLRYVDELSTRFERRQGPTSISTVQDGTFYAGFVAVGRVYVARFDEAICRLDTGFGDQGVVQVPTPRFATVQALNVRRHTDGHVLTALSITGAVELRRFDATGQWDTGFGTEGLAVNPNTEGFWFGGLAVGADGQILVTGSVILPFSTQPALLKLDAQGKPVVSFGDGGVQRYPEITGVAGAQGLLVEQDRVVFVGGTATSVATSDFGSNDSFIAAADLATGRLLPSFGDGGFLRWDWGYGNSNQIFSIVPNGRGGYTTCGHTIRSLVAGQPAALVDITSTGQFDASVPYQGRRLIAGTDAAGCAGMARLPDGRLAVGINDAKQVVVAFFAQ